MFNSLNLRQIVFIALALLVVGSVGWWLISRLNTGVLIVRTDQPDSTISVIQSEPSGELITDQIGQGSAEVRLKSGNYTVAAEYQGQATVTAVAVTRGETTSVELSLMALKSSRTLLDATASQLAVSGQTVKYLNPQQGALYQFTKGDRRSFRLAGELRLGSATLPDVPEIFNLQWLNFNQALAVTDATGVVGIFEGSRFRPLGLPGTGGNEDTNITPAMIGFDTGPGGNFAVSVLNNLFYFSRPNAERQLLSESISQGSIIRVSSRGQVLVFDDVSAPSETPQDQTVTLFAPGSTAKTLDFGGLTIIEAVWSPDGKTLALVSKQGVWAYTLADGSLSKLTHLNPDITAAVEWLDGESLAMVTRNALWQLDISSRIMTKLADTAENITATDPLLITGTAIYYTTAPVSHLQAGRIVEVSLD